MRKYLVTLISLTAALFPAAIHAETQKPPYWAVVGTEEMNMRVGPSVEYKITWVYKRKGLPVKVVRVIDGWRLVQDHTGTKGWVNSALINEKRRGAIVVGEGLAAIRAAASDSAKLKWNVKPGVVGKLGECAKGWCLFNVGGREGWVRADRLWGAGKA